MRYVVAVKQVPDTMEVRTGEDGSLVRAGVPAIMDPYSQSALMQTLSLKEDGDTVAVVTMGPPQAEQMLRRCIGLGADSAYLLTDRDFAGADTRATARVLAAFIGRYEPDADLYIFGRQAIDGDTGQVPAEVAQLIDSQQFYYTSSLRIVEDGFEAVQDYGSFIRTSRVPRGSVVSFGDADAGGCLQSLSGYIRGSRADIATIGRVDLGLGLYSVGLKGSKTAIVSSSTVKDGRKGMKVEITNPSTAADFIIKEAKAVR